MFLDYETILVWHVELCQIMEYPRVDILAWSLYGVVESVYLENHPEYEVVVNHLSRWWEPFDLSKTLKIALVRSCTGCEQHGWLPANGMTLQEDKNLSYSLVMIS